MKLIFCMGIQLCRPYKINGSNYNNECMVGPTMGGGNHEISTSSGKNLIVVFLRQILLFTYTLVYSDEYVLVYNLQERSEIIEGMVDWKGRPAIKGKHGGMPFALLSICRSIS